MYNYFYFLWELGNSALALEFVSIIQDYCLHLCLTGKEEASQCSSIPLASTPVALHPYQLNQQDKQRSKQTCRYIVITSCLWSFIFLQIIPYT